MVGPWDGAARVALFAIWSGIGKIESERCCDFGVFLRFVVFGVTFTYSIRVITLLFRTKTFVFSVLRRILDGLYLYYLWLDLLVSEMRRTINDC